MKPAKTPASRTMRDRVRADTRAALLRASEQVFAEKGIDGARIEDIAARAGVAVGTIYNYFGDSTELLDALILERRRDLIAHLDEALASAKRQRTSWPGQVEAFISSTMDCTRDHLPFYAILMQCENRKTPSSMGGVSTEFYKRAQTLVRWGVNVGRVRPADAAILPALLVSMCRAPLLFLRQMSTNAAWDERLTEQLVRFFCAAATSVPSPPRPALAVGRRVRKPSPVGA